MAAAPRSSRYLQSVREPPVIAADHVERLRQHLHVTPARLIPGACSALGCKRAAVAAILRASESHGGLECLYITRAARPGDPWSGDVAWPGGRLEPGETDLEAAVRETEEEIGLKLGDQNVFTLLGPLPDRPAVRSLGNVKLVVRTFVFLQIAKETPKMKLSPHEVGAAWWVALGYMCHPPKPLPLFQVPIERLSTRFPFLKGPNALRLAHSLCLDTALFPYVALPHSSGDSSQQPLRLWGVTLGLSSELVAAMAHEAFELSVPPWRLQNPFWDALLAVAAWAFPAQFTRT